MTAEHFHAEGVTSQLADYAASFDYKSMPAELIAMTKQCILDTLGVTTAASSLGEEAPAIDSLVREMGGAGRSTVLGFGYKTSASWAAFANGSLGHMIDFDDVSPGGHVSISTVPVAFSIAEHLGGVSGPELLAAIAVGADIQVRLGMSVRDPEWLMTQGWFATQLLGFIGGAVVAGRLLGLDAEKLSNAMGLAYGQLGGSRQMAVGSASQARSLQAGFTGHGAVISALLAERGITGPREIIEGRYGLFQNYIRGEEPDWNIIAGSLGKDFPLLRTHGFKVWPSCSVTRSPLAAIFAMRERHHIEAEQVDSVLVIGGGAHTQLLCEPIESKRRPSLGIDAKYSIPFVIGVALTAGDLSLGAFTDEALKNPAVLAMTERVNFRAAAHNEEGAEWPPAIEIRTRDGALYRERVAVVPGDPHLQVSQRDVENKFVDCLKFSAVGIPRGADTRVIDLVNTLESVPDAAEIMRVLSSA